MKTVNIAYFASLREEAKLDAETVTVGCRTYSDLYNELASKHGFSLPAAMIQAAANDEFVQMGSEIEEGVRVVFIPPIAGG